jgi:anti-sigma B factor antagonist
MNGFRRTQRGRAARCAGRSRSEPRTEAWWTEPTTPRYEIRRWEAGPRAHLIVASGELDLDAAPAMRRTLASLTALGRDHLVIDMSAATFVDSAMIGVLVGHVRRVRSAGGSLTIACSNENVLRTFQVAGLEREVELVSGLSDAVLERVTTMPRPHPSSNLLAAPRTQMLKVLAHPSQLAFARGFVTAAARRAGLDPRKQYDLALAVNEALANAIEHGIPCRDGYIELWVHERRSSLTVGVRNRGEFVLEPLPPDPLPERGRGLRLMRHSVDRVSLQHENAQTTVELSILREVA